MLTPRTLAVLVVLLAINGPASTGVIGDWREPSGAVIRVAPCAESLCATLVAISPDAPETQDKLNPDPAARSYPLCGLVIGKSFHAQTGSHAEGGTLYDPKSGKTYRGEMTADGDTLRLRGYIGVKLFGRTETWKRTPQGPVCHPA